MFTCGRAISDNPWPSAGLPTAAGELKIFAGSSNPALAGAVCKYLKVPVGGAKIDRFPDGEKIIRIEDDVRGRDCFVVQSTCRPVDEHLVELLIYLDCLRRASAARITAVIPYFGYARQDRKAEGRVPITAKLVANLITTAGADRVLAIDLHTAQVQGFFDIPVDHLTGELVLSKYFRDKSALRSNLTVVSPDVGNMKTASRYAAHLGGELAIVHKKRMSGSKVQAYEIIGEVEGRNILMCDDIIATAGTVCSAASLVKKRGAESIYVGATHGVLTGNALEKLQEGPIDEVVVTDTIPLHPSSAAADYGERMRERPNLSDDSQELPDATLRSELRSTRKIEVLTVSGMLGEAIKRIHRNESVSSLFNEF